MDQNTDNLFFTIDKLKLPNIGDLDSSSFQGTKVCVVTIIGKSRYNPYRTKADIVNSLVDSDVFVGSNGKSSDNLCQLEGYCDADKRVILLHLRSSYDGNVLADVCKLADEDVTLNGCAGVLRMAEYSHTRALLFVFLVSHIILLVQPSGSFDTSYVRLFRTLDAVRQKIQPTVSDLLKRLTRSNSNIGISKDWILAGRPCSPRLLFIFEGCRVPDVDEAESTASKSHSQKSSPVKTLQHAIEDQIYRILRKARIITNTSNNSLFAVPANQEFVYIQPHRCDTNDLVTYYMEQLRTSCNSHGKSPSSTSSRSYRLNRRAAASQSFTSVDTEDGTPGTSGPQASSSSSISLAEPAVTQSLVRSTDFPVTGFAAFLQPHIELALSRGFDDNVGRNPVAAIFELPMVADWFAVGEQLHSVFWADLNSDSRVQSQLSALKALTDIDVRFSESRCTKALPIATSFYQEGLPTHYIRAVHLAKLKQAKRVFAMHARGPACERYIEQLEQECERLWKNGRQMCEEISLTGNHCVNELHRILDVADMSEEIRRLPVMPHSSQIKTRATCNCGRRQGEREDPFDHRSANCDFFERLEQICCSELIHYEMSVFKPSTADVRPAALSSALASPRHVDDSTTKSQKMAGSVHKNQSKFEMSSLSLALSLSQPGDIFHQPTEAVSPSAEKDSDGYDDNGDIDANNSIEGNDVTSSGEDVPVVVGSVESNTQTDINALSTQRQHSTTEYLPGMLHTNSPPGLLPKFPSWSILMLSDYISYSPLQGVDQPGFTHGCNYLLPIDITVKIDRERWSSGGDGTAWAKKPIKARKGVKDLVDVTLRLYIGLEYECPRGHRFFLCAPDRIFRVPPSGLYKETAHRVINHDMPLYFPCTCRSALIGQLMRLHIAVPDGPVEARVRPKVQPGPPPCPLFFPGADDPLVLHSGVWIIRLPYVYLGENGPYRMPNDPQNVLSCKFVRGFVSLVESSSVGS